MGAPAALGTGTDEAVISSSYKVPTSARNLMAIMPLVHTTAPAAAESVFVVVGIRGTDFKNQPFEIFAPIGGSHLGTIGGNIVRDPRWHQMNYKLTGNETFTIYAEALDAMAGNARIGMNFLYSDVAPSGRQPPIKSICSRETAVGTAATTFGGTAVTIQNGLRVISLEAAVTGSTVTADEPLSAHLNLNSTGFTPVNDVDVEMIADTIEATSGIQICYPTKAPIDVKIKGSTIQIVPTFTNRLALTAAGQGGFCLKYI
jgi:hypothetical protein